MYIIYISNILSPQFQSSLWKTGIFNDENDIKIPSTNEKPSENKRNIVTTSTANV